MRQIEVHKRGSMIEFNKEREMLQILSTTCKIKAGKIRIQLEPGRNCNRRGFLVERFEKREPIRKRTRFNRRFKCFGENI